MFELYLMDLTPEKRREFLEAHGCWDADVEDPSTFPNDWGMVPIMTFDPDELDSEQELNKAYQKYLHQWYADHSGPEYEGMEPVCFDEFINNEYLEGGY